MKNSLKKELMFCGVSSCNRNPNRIKIKNNVYEISNRLRIKLKIKNILLSIGVISFTFFYRYTLDKKFNISYNEATLETWKQGLLLTIFFMLSIVILFFVISYILIPNDLTIDDIRLIKE